MNVRKMIHFSVDAAFLLVLLGGLIVAVRAQSAQAVTQKAPQEITVDPAKTTVLPRSEDLTRAQQQARLARLESAVTREQLQMQAIDKTRAEQRAIAADACKAIGVEDISQCSIDLNAKTPTGDFDLAKAIARRAPDPPAKPAPAK